MTQDFIFLLAYLNITNYYTIRTEHELNKGYADLYLEPFVVQHPELTTSYLIELKYIKPTEKKPSAAAIKAQVTEATTQLTQYAQGPFFLSTIPHTELKELVMVRNGWEIVEMR